MLWVQLEYHNIHLQLEKEQNQDDVILLTEGSGGGTITTTAIYHGMFDVVWETMDISFIKASEAIFQVGNIA